MRLQPLDTALHYHFDDIRYSVRSLHFISAVRLSNAGTVAAGKTHPAFSLMSNEKQQVS